MEEIDVLKEKNLRRMRLVRKVWEISPETRVVPKKKKPLKSGKFDWRKELDNENM
jgi:hypothetical protein